MRTIFKPGAILAIAAVVVVMQIGILVFIGGFYEGIEFRTQKTASRPSLLKLLPIYNDEYGQCSPPTVDIPEARMLFAKYKSPVETQSLSEYLCKMERISTFYKGTLTIHCSWSQFREYRLSSNQNITGNSWLYTPNDEEYYAKIDPTDNDVDEDFYRVRSSEWKTYYAPVQNIKDELIETRCYWPFKYGITYNYHVQSVRNEKAVERASALSSRQSRPNVLFLLLDMVSMGHADRMLEETNHILHAINASRSKLFRFDGYNVVGEDSFENQSPMLAGHFHYNLPPVHNQRGDLGWVGPSDHWPFIFKYYAQHGYVTNYASDDCVTVFWWKKKIADHMILKKAFCTFSGFDPYASSPHCVGNKLAHELQLSYIKDFWDTYHDLPKASFHWFSEGHEDTGRVISTIDHDFAQFFKRLEDESILDNTVVFLVSDHGPRYGWYRSTRVGMTEHKFPLFHMLVPSTFLKENPKIHANLASNQKKLITSFEMHATLKHLLFPTETPLRSSNGTFFEQSDDQTNLRTIVPWSYSLLEEMPQRSCEEAKIDPLFCGCLRWQMMYHFELSSQANATIVTKLATLLTARLNAHTDAFRDICYELKFKSVVQAWSAKFDTRSMYQVEFSASPGSNTFEGEILADLSLPEATWEVKSLKRTSSYSQDKVCGLDKPTRMYCVCKKAKQS